MNLKKKLLFLILSVAFFAGCFIQPVFSQVDVNISSPDLGVQYPAYSGLTNADVRIVVAKIIRAALGLLGTVLVAYIIYGGYLWLTAGGNEGNIDKAKMILTSGTIGLAIILSAFAISNFIVTRLVEATTSGDATTIY